MPRPFSGPQIHPEDQNNPTCENFQKNCPVEKQFVISARLHEQRPLDRAGRAICRIVYAHGFSVRTIAHISCVSEETVRRAVQNRNRFEQSPDDVGSDYFHAPPEYLEEYPPLNGVVPAQVPSPRRQTRSSSYRITNRVKQNQVKPLSQTKSKKKRDCIREPSVIDLSEDTPSESDQDLPLAEKAASKKSLSAVPVLSDTKESSKGKTNMKGGKKRARSFDYVSRIMLIKQSQPLKCNPSLMKLESIQKFLSDVGGFDLSSWEADFRSKGISSVQSLAIIAKWDEEKRIRSLSKLFPEMSEIHRFALLEALGEMKK